MSLKITDVLFNSGLGGYDAANNQKILQANLQDWVRATIFFEFENTNVLTTSNPITIKPTDLNSLNVDDVIYIKNNQFIKELKVGDTIRCQSIDSSVNYDFNVIEIISQNYIRVDGVSGLPFVTTATFTSGNIINLTEFTGIKFEFGLNSSGVGFTSLTDGSLQSAINKNLHTTLGFSDLLEMQGKKDWQNGSINYILQTIDDTKGITKFALLHEFHITPLFLFDQYNDLINNVSPSYFKGGSNLIYNFKITLAREFTDLTNARTVSYIDKSNTGWLNESFNGGANNYAIESLVITNTVTSNVVDQLQLNSNSEVVFTLKSLNASFTDSVDYVRVGVCSLPDKKNLYTNTNEELFTNFTFDYLDVLNDNVAVNGDNYGTDLQLIKDVKAEFIDSETIEVTVNIEAGADIIDLIERIDLKRYLLTCSVGFADRVNLLVQTSAFSDELLVTNIIDSDTFFIEHPYDSIVFGVDELDIQPLDDVACNTSFFIDFTDLKNDSVSIKSATCSLVLTHATQSDVILEQEIINVQNSSTISYPHSSGGTIDIQDINYFKQRPFKIPSEIRRNIVFARDYDNDDVANDKYYFAVNYPFMFRWEYWEQLILSQKSADFFDSAEDFNGYNHNWYRLASQSGWSLVYRIEFVIERLGKLYEQIFENSLNAFTFEDNPDFGTCSIKSYDINTNDELLNGSIKLIKGYEDVSIVATFEKTTNIPDVADVGIVMWIETFEKGGIKDIRRISSMHDNDSQSWFKENRVTVANPSSGVFTGTATLEYSKIPQDSQYTIYARFYEINSAPELGRITNDDIIRITMDGNIRLVL